MDFTLYSIINKYKYNQTIYLYIKMKDFYDGSDNHCVCFSRHSYVHPRMLGKGGARSLVKS